MITTVKDKRPDSDKLLIFQGLPRNIKVTIGKESVIVDRAELLRKLWGLSEDIVLQRLEYR